MKKTILALILLFCATGARAQTSAVTATITDSDAQTWNNGTYTITFVPSPTNSSPPIWNGSPMTTAQKGPYTGTLSGVGVLTVSLPDNAFITPPGSQWLFVLCSNTSAPCSQVQTTVTGASPNLSTTLSNGVKAPRFPAIGSALARGYADAEVSPTPPQGGEYYNVTSNTVRVWSGSSWAALTPGGGSGTVTGTGVANQVAFWTSASAIGGDTGLTYVPATKSFLATGGASSVSGILAGPSALNQLAVQPSEVDINGGEANTNLVSSFTHHIDFTSTGGHIILNQQGVGAALGLNGQAVQIQAQAASGDVTINSSSGNVGVTVGSANRFNFPTATGTSGQVLSTNGANPQILSWITAATGTVTGSGATPRLAIWNGASSLTSNANLTYDVNGTLTSIGSALATSGVSAGNNQIQVNGLSAGNTIGLLAGETGATIVLQSKNLNAASANGELDLGANVASFGGVLGLLGATSGTAKIQVAAVAGTPNPLQLPTATGTSGQVLSTNGANPQVLSWIAAGGTGTVTNVATTSPITGGPITTTGTIACATCVTSAAALTSNQLMTGAGSQASQTLGTLGTTTTVLHGNAGGAPTFGAVNLTSDVTGTLPIANGGTGQTTANPAFNALSPMTTLGDIIFENSTPAGARLAGPTATNGVPQTLTSTPSGGLATAPAWSPAGVPTNAQTGTSYTVAATDRASYVSFSNAASIAVTLPQAGSTGFASSFVTKFKNIGAGVVTVTPTTSTIDGNATMVLNQGESAFVYSDNTNYFSARDSGQLSAGTNITFTRSATGTSIAASGGASFPLLAPNGSAGAPSYSFSGATSDGMYFNTGYSAPAISSGSVTSVVFVAAGPLIGPTAIYGFETGGNPADVAFSRGGSATVDVGSGAAADTSGKIKAAAYMSVGTKFTASGCTNSATVGGATAGQFTSGTTGACTVTVTMGNSATAPNGWACWASDQTTPANTYDQKTGGSTTTAVFTGTTVTNDVISFGCVGY
jgi:hypothetical protein